MPNAKKRKISANKLGTSNSRKSNSVESQYSFVKKDRVQYSGCHTKKDRRK